MTKPIDSLDFSMFGTADYVNIILQRSEVLEGVQHRGRIINQWTNGESQELAVLAAEANTDLARRAMRDVAQEFEDLADVLSETPPTRIADIGCGYAFFDLIAADRFGAEIDLIDVETKDDRHFGFDDRARAQSNLSRAVKFLTSNGVKKSRITATNPSAAQLDDLETVDLAVSFLGCGFHYSVEAYMSFFQQNVAAGGRIILDIRKAREAEQLEMLASLGKVTVLSEVGNRKRVMVQKPAEGETQELGELSKTDWRDHLKELGEVEGFFEELGDQHSALYVDKGDTLIVTFENLDHVYNFTGDRMPWGYGFVTGRGWSMLGLMAHDWTWYRDEAVFDFFDRLRDEGFFDKFKKVVFYGASMGGYAAAAFSAAAPNATVILISPQATLDRQIAPWEHRYLKAWSRNFKDRYGYAPDLVAQAKDVYLFYDPRMPQDAMHATLFNSENIQKFTCKFFGHRMASLWVQMGVLKTVIDGCLDGTITREGFYKLMRKRRDTGRYMREFLDMLEAKGNPWRVAYYCQAVLNRRRGPKFRIALKNAQEQMKAKRRRR